MPPIFEIAEGDLPFVRTRQALLLLDLQNDFLAKDCLLPVEDPVNLIKNSTDLASQFRNTGDVIWVRSQFSTSRAINDKTNPDSELIITDDQLRQAKRSGKADENAGVTSRLSSKLLQKNNRLAGKVAGLLASEPEEEEEDVLDRENQDKEPNEAFLTPGPGRRSRIVLPESPGANLALDVVKGLDNSKDLIFQKSHYSAFKDEHLIQTLRGKFVTELFICGSLTNISVFATAMDAARHGLAITLVEDCLGYRSKARHDEALRQLTDYTGCDIISSAELIEELKRKEKARARERDRRSAPKRDARPRTDKKDNSALEQMMRKLQLSGSSTKKVEPVKAEDSARSARSQSPSLTKRSDLATPQLAASHGNIRDSFDDESTLDMELPTRPEPQKRERVKAKIKTRRRHSNTSRPTSKQSEVSVDPSSAEPTSKSATTSTLEEASDALAKMSLKNREETGLAPIAVGKASVGADDKKVSTTESDTTIPVSQDSVTSSEKQTITETTAPTLCEGDTEVINDVLTGELVEGIFEKVRNEVRWQRMSHQGGEVPRLVSVQGEVAEDGSMPIYRHPTDESIPLVPFSPTIFEIKKQVEKKLGHSLNHVLIQFYRDGSDHITEHSDKTLDIVPDTYIANVSLGAQRTMVFRTKKQPTASEKDGQPVQRESCRAPLPHNSMCKMGLLTNMRWLHGIRPDKRLEKEKSAAELAYAGGRISLTFRMIGTFLDKGQTKIWGQGAVSKAKDSANPVVNGKTPAAEEMLIAFGKENHSSKFDWKASYGSGFDVLHISNSRKLFLSGDFISDVRVKFTLAVLGIDWSEGSLSPAFNLKSGNEGMPDIPQSIPVKFIENDLSRSSIEGDLAVLLYLSTVYGAKLSSAASQARTINRFFAVTAILDKWRAKPFMVKPFRSELLIWDSWSSESEFIAGDSISIVDFAFWPLLDEIQRGWGNLEDLNNLSAYHTRLRKLASLEKILGSSGDLGSTPIVSTSKLAKESDEASKEDVSPNVGGEKD